VPYCKQCLKHIHDEKAYLLSNEESMHLSVIVGLLSLVAWVFAAIGSTRFGLPEEAYFIWIGFLFCLVVLFVWATYPACARRHRLNLAAIEERRNVIKARVEENLCLLCSSRGHLALRYNGWREESHYGEWQEEWHYFDMANAAFLELMLELNSDKAKKISKS
jgi:hypothetical protein